MPIRVAFPLALFLLAMLLGAASSEGQTENTVVDTAQEAPAPTEQPAVTEKTVEQIEIAARAR